MARIMERLPLHSILTTPSGRATFELYHIDGEKSIMKTSGGTCIKLPSSCFEDAPGFLRGRGWVKIGASHKTPRSTNETFDDFLKSHCYGVSVASYVAAILEEAGMVEIDRSRPAKIRLKEIE